MRLTKNTNSNLPCGTWLGAKAIEEAIRAKRVTSWKVFMMSIVFVALRKVVCFTESILTVDFGLVQVNESSYVSDVCPVPIFSIMRSRKCNFKPLPGLSLRQRFVPSILRPLWLETRPAVDFQREGVSLTWQY